MIDVKNLTKIYRPKNGAEVYALNGVTLSLEEKGMVFLLGKSGSGKSTLLNVMGGLDKYDSGEIIVKGKSSLKFTQQDFDSYRNTFIGFIFQEYNILEEFSVAQNIGLALQLQHKKADAKTVEAILEQVDLTGYGRRKPNELSGGQKQRVAIARALIKDPEIIMADEPTGALDSKTGRQVFETLKKLSKTKLVIVVSHDRESAEIYGDRIIELADGKVISDTQKYYAPSQKVNDGLDIIDNKIIRIKKGYTLTASDTQVINNALSNADFDAIISVDAKSNSEFKRVAKLDDEGNKEAFKETKDLTLKEYDPKNFKLIKSRLPFKESFRIGASGLKSKKIRLVLTILLSVVSFSLFGLSDTMASYDMFNATLESLRDSNINYTAISKTSSVYNEQYDYWTNYDESLSDSDFVFLDDKLKDFSYTPIYKIGKSAYESIAIPTQSYSNYYQNTISGVAEFEDQSEYEKMGLTKLYGEFPTKANEVAISKFFFDSMVKLVPYLNGTVVNLTEYKDICGKEFSVSSVGNEKKIKITAVIDTGFNEERYSVLDSESGISSISDMMLQAEFMTNYRYSFHGSFMAAKGFYEENFKDYQSLSTSYGRVIREGQYGYEVKIFEYLRSFDEDSTNYYFKDGVKKQALADNEMGMSLEQLIDLDYSLYEEFYYNYDNYIDNYLITHNDAILAKYGITDPYYTATDIYYNGYYDEQDYIYPHYEIKEIISNIYVEEFINKYAFADDSPYKTQSLTMIDMNTYWREELEYEYKDYNLSAIFVDPLFIKMELVHDYTEDEYNKYYSEKLRTFAIFNQTNLEKIYKQNGDISYVMVKLTGDDARDMELIKFSYQLNEIEGKHLTFGLKNAVSDGINMLNSLIEALAMVFLYVGIGFMVFSALLLLNFITVSISYKKREIGVLRAVGARSTDVFGIFFNESLIIVVINMILALLATAIVANLLNTTFRNQAGLLITPLSFGLRQVLLMFLACITTAAISTFIPVFRFAKKKPIDAINNR